jgi:hypothetical protein
MSRHDRRKAKAKSRKFNIKIKELHSHVDIWFEHKVGQVLMIIASPVGQKAAEDLWPDIQWSRDEKFAASHAPPDWGFAHIRVTKLQPHFETLIPLAFASGDSLAYAGATALGHHAPHLCGRIGWWTGPLNDPHNNRFNILGSIPTKGPARDNSFFVEYISGRYLTGDPVRVN